ncbi:hypothetical protein PNEG_03465 [Pneumocystis murina B123]|uniref:Uncharacterized protein n=1 Tax=Pneumocystis murina (strain B123) TaxID=1069680 RepID=M7NHI6_PNEMU|nr:hypothetical protein PNEG_03465 [Pneumocystis murina B123]EMR08023.1 hypothetical protein PNEG_03465 [Pneumocystis murina B123]
MRPKSVGGAISESQPAALHAARLAMLKQLNVHLPIEESKIWNDDTQADVVSLRSMDRGSVITGMMGYASIPDSHYRIPKQRLSVPLFVHDNQECSRFQALRRNKFSTFSFRSPSKKRSAAGRFVLHLKRTFLAKNLLFQRPVPSSSQYKENFCSSFTLKELSKNEQVSPLAVCTKNTLTNVNQPLSKMDENTEFSQLKKKIASLEILETQNGKENQPLSDDRKSLTILPEENNNNVFITTIENDIASPSFCMSCDTSIGSIDHRDNAGPVRLFTDDLSPSPKLNSNLYRSHCTLPYQEQEVTNSSNLLYYYHQNPSSLSTHTSHSPHAIPYNSPSSKLEEMLYSKTYHNVRSPSGLEKAVNFNYGGIDEWRREIRNSMHLERRKKDEKNLPLFF